MKNSEFNKTELRQAFKATVPVMAGYIVLGMGFGIILKTKGYGVLWAFAMSVFIYAGSMQFVAVDLLTGGASLITVALTTLMVNARHLFYGISMIDRYKNAGAKKPYLVFALTDETYSLVCKPDSHNINHNFCFAVSLFDQIYWVAGSVVGSMLGSVIPFNTEGIDFALTALFVTVFTEQWLDSKSHSPALIGLLASLVCLLIFKQNNFLIPSMIIITALLVIIRKREAVNYD